MCAPLKFVDGTCSAGASVCETAEGVPREVYGYSDSIQLAWERDGAADVVSMTMTGVTSCKKDPTKATTTKIFFSCDETGTKEHTLRAESECVREFG